MNNNALLCWAEAVSLATSVLLESLSQDGKSLGEPSCSEASQEQNRARNIEGESPISEPATRSELPVNHESPCVQLGENDKRSGTLELQTAPSDLDEETRNPAQRLLPWESQNMYRHRQNYAPYKHHFWHIRKGYRGAHRDGYRNSYHKTYRRGSPHSPPPLFERMSK